MRRKLDHLPRGVRWAVRILRIAGTVLTMPVVFIIPLMLLFAGAMMIQSGSPWIFDLVAIISSLPIVIGAAMRVTATCMELGHDPSSYDSNCETEWKNFATAGLSLLSVTFVFGGVVSLIQLLAAWRGKGPEIALPAVNLALHLGLTILLYRSVHPLERWFEKRRRMRETHPGH